jgi:hypothetical protein
MTKHVGGDAGVSQVLHVSMLRGACVCGKMDKNALKLEGEGRRHMPRAWRRRLSAKHTGRRRGVPGAAAGTAPALRSSSREQ